MIIVLLSNFCSSQQIDSRLNDFFIDTSIRLKAINILDFIKNSTTMRLNDYSPVFISLDADDLKYEKINNRAVNAQGIFHLYVSNQMIFDKNAKKLYCFEVEQDNKYLVVRVNEKFNDEYYLIKKNKQCECNKLFSFNRNKPASPQSAFSYSVNNGIPLLYSAASLMLWSF